MSRRVIHRGAKFDFEQVEYRGADGRVLVREVVRHPGAVVIVPILRGDDGVERIVLIRNWRVSLGDWLWELPAGTRENGEAPEATAARELVEETGYRAGRIRALGRFYTSPGLSDELMWAFVAEDLTLEKQKLEADERISVHTVEVGEVMGMIERGGLMDGKSVLGVLGVLGVLRVRGEGKASEG
ncbi:MAG: NUDIX hydrolase [Phycisphaerales bacterium]|nr:NUDIX hydrolase [Phycisphaerales bacterium]